MNLYFGNYQLAALNELKIIGVTIDSKHNIHCHQSWTEAWPPQRSCQQLTPQAEQRYTKLRFTA